ncbi:hypothetical protein ACXZ66_04070 [Corynebacterium sp. S7]
MLDKFFRRGVAEVSGVPHPAVAGLRLESERDARGFPIGIVVPRHADEASIALSVADASTVSSQRVSSWHDELSSNQTVIATCSSITFQDTQATAVLWATFEASSAERKETSEFLTRLARSAPAAYDLADSNGMDTRPLSPEEVSTWVGAGLIGMDDVDEFPPRARNVSEGPAALLVDGQVTISFEVDAYDGEDDVITAVTEIGENFSIGTHGALSVRVGTWARSAENDASSPRRVGIVSLTASSSEVVEDAALILIADLDARQRLHVRRMWHRQAVGAGASLGTGVLGWQRLEVSA